MPGAKDCACSAMLTALLRDGVIAEVVYEELVTEIDAALERVPHHGEDAHL
jgi:hypothetical protein